MTKLINATYFHVWLISVLDNDFLVNVGKVPLPKISQSLKTNIDVQTFIDEFMKGTNLTPGSQNESIGTVNGIKAPKKNVSITKFKEFLEENKDWTEWKFSVKIQISIEKDKEKEKEKQSSEQSRPSLFRLIL